jgi:thiol-disulfide isomerase/thioredoxin
MRLMSAAVISFFLGLLLACADDRKPSDAKMSREDKLKTILKKYDTELNDLKKRYNSAKSAQEKNGIKEEAREATVLTSRDALALAEEDPKDSVAFEAAVFVVEKVMSPGKELEGALAILGENHLDNPKIKDLLTPRLASAGLSAQKFFQNVVEKSKDTEAKGLALFFQGVSTSAQLEDEEDEKKINEVIAKAKEYFLKAAELSPGAKVGDTTVGKAATTEIESMEAIKNLGIGKPVPDVSGTNLEGKAVKISSFKGNVVLLDIWATWCGPCRAMIPHEREMVKKLEKKPFKLVSVSCDNDKETLTSFFEKEPMPWDHWFDGPQGTVAKLFRVRAFPTLYLIDHTGVIRNKWIGNPGNDKLEKAVEDLVAEAIKVRG